MALFDSVLYRITGITNCIVYFENAIDCKSDSVAVPNGDVFYVSHCTGNSVSINVASGLYEIVTTSPITYTFSACSSNSAFTDTIMIFGYDNQFDTSVSDITYYFSAITSHANPSNYYPCQFEGCWSLLSSGDTNTSYFYSSYLVDSMSAGTCSDCGTTYHSGDPIYEVNSGCCFTDFCLFTEYTPFSGYDGNYVSAGTYNGQSYFTGGSNPGFVYYSTGDTSWCLSTSLGGNCDLFGAKPCYSPCPDICDEIFGGNICPTPTPTPTINCSLNDFTALFDCDVQPTPTPTPTITPTTTTTPTPTVTINPCILVDAFFSVNLISPTPTPTPTVTPIPYVPPFECFITDSVLFNTFQANILCPDGNRSGAVYIWEDCNSGSIYLTDLISYSGGSYVEGDTFFAKINGINGCVRFSGVTGGSITSLISLIDYAGVDCSFCSAIVPSPTPTPTVTITLSVTPTITMTPTPSTTIQSIIKKWFIFKLCTTFGDSQIIAMDLENALLSSLGFGPGLGYALQYGTNINSMTYSDPTKPFQWTVWEFREIITGDIAQLNAQLLINYTPIQSGFPIIYNGDFFTDNGITATNPNLPTNCVNNTVTKPRYPIYIFTNCNSGPGGEAVFVFQYPPFNTFPIVYGKVIKYNDGINNPCWSFGYNGTTVVYGNLNTLNVPASPLYDSLGTNLIYHQVTPQFNIRMQTFSMIQI